MKRLLSFILAFTLLLAFTGNISANADEKVITVLVDGAAVEFDVLPQIINDRTMVPVRAIFEALGATVEWNDETKTVTATDGETIVSLTINSNVIKVNDTEKTIDVPAMIVNDRTLVPVRAISEAFECTVEWDQDTYTVIITSAPEEFVVIDFTEDDGTMSELQYVTRYGFEQIYLPNTIFENEDVISQLLMDEPKDLMAVIDDQIWGAYRDAVIVNYMEESEEEFVVSSEEELYEIIDSLADKYYLRAYQAYTADYFTIDVTNYCMMLSMTEITDYLMLDELSKMLLSSYVAFVYDSEEDTFRYFTLEKSFEDLYMFCEITAEGEHINYGIVENSMQAFTDAVMDAVRK